LSVPCLSKIVGLLGIAGSFSPLHKGAGSDEIIIESKASMEDLHQDQIIEDFVARLVRQPREQDAQVV